MDDRFEHTRKQPHHGQKHRPGAERPINGSLRRIRAYILDDARTRESTDDRTVRPTDPLSEDSWSVSPQVPKFTNKGPAESTESHTHYFFFFFFLRSRRR